MKKFFLLSFLGFITLPLLADLSVNVEAEIKNEETILSTYKAAIPIESDFRYVYNLPPALNGLSLHSVSVNVDGAKFSELHKYFALCVGVDFYSPLYPQNPLKFCVSDAKAIGDLLCSGAWKASNVVLFQNNLATLENVRNGLKTAAQNLGAGDTFVYFQSSHGGTRKGFHLCCYDGPYGVKELAEDLSLFKDGVKVVVILDACNSGGMISKEEISKEVLAKMAEIRTKRRGVDFGVAKKAAEAQILFLVASKKNEVSYEGTSHGIFVESLLQATNLAPDLNGDCILSFGELFDTALYFLKAYGFDKQHPVISDSKLGYNIPLAVVSSQAYGNFICRDGFCEIFLPKVLGDCKVSLILGKPEEPIVTTFTAMNLQENLQTGLSKGNFKFFQPGNFETTFPFFCPFTFSLLDGIFKIGKLIKVAANGSSALYSYDDGAIKTTMKIKNDKKRNKLFFTWKGNGYFGVANYVTKDFDQFLPSFYTRFQFSPTYSEFDETWVFLGVKFSKKTVALKLAKKKEIVVF